MNDDQIKKLEDRGWSEMLPLLDKELPQHNRKKKFVWLWWSSAAALFLIGSFLILNVKHPEKTSFAKAQTKETTVPLIENQNSDIATLAEQDQTAFSPVTITGNPNSLGRSTSSLSNNSSSKEKISTTKNDTKPHKNSNSSVEISLPTHNFGLISNNSPEDQQSADTPNRSGEHLGSNPASQNLSNFAVQEIPNAIHHWIQIPQISHRDHLLLTATPKLELKRLDFPKPIQENTIPSGFNLGIMAYTSLSNKGQNELGPLLSYRHFLGGKFAIDLGAQLGYTDLNIAYGPINGLNGPGTPLIETEKSNSNQFLDSNNFSSSNSSHISSKMVLSVSFGVGYALTPKLLLETNAGIRNYFMNGSNIYNPNTVTQGNGLAVESNQPLSFKNHYFQTLDLHYYLRPSLNVKASYMFTGQPITTGFVIDKKVGKFNQFVGIGLEHTF